MRKRVISLLLTLLFTLSACPAVFASGELRAVYRGGVLTVSVDGNEQIQAGTNYLILIAGPDETLFYMTSELAHTDGGLTVSLAGLPDFDPAALAAGSYRVRIANAAFHVLAEGLIVRDSGGSGGGSGGSGGGSGSGSGGSGGGFGSGSEIKYSRKSRGLL